MGKKNNKGKTSSYKPSIAGLTRPKLDPKMQQMAAEPTKRPKKEINKNKGDESEEIDKKSKVTVTDEMFEAAKLMKNGVSHIKDLDYSVVKREKSLKQAPGNCEVTIIDIKTGDVKMARVQKPLNKDACRFDFNSEADFNPDTDAAAVAKKAWDWLLNPIGFDNFTKNIKDQKILIIQNRVGYTYKQDDPEDDLLSLENFRQFVQETTEGAQKSGDPSLQLKYGNEVDVVKFINGKRHTVNPSSGVVESDLLFDFFDNQKCSIRLSRPHEFSTSLAKMMSMSDEVFENEAGANVYITPYPHQTKVEQGFAPHYDDIDAFLLQLEGKKQWNLYKPPNDEMLLDLEPSKDFPASLITENKLKKYWSGTLNEGDILYMPRGVIHFGKTFAEPAAKTQHSLHVTLSNQQHNSWTDLLRASFKQTMTRLTKEDMKFRAGLPTDLFSKPDKSKAQLSEMIDSVAEAMKEDEQMQHAIWKWQSRFLFRRQAPQELLKTNMDQEGDDDEDMQDAPVLTQKVDKDQASSSSDKDDSDENDNEDNGDSDNSEESKLDDKYNPANGDNEQPDELDFQEVKLCTKHAAFIRHRPNEGYFIHYATQNERSQQAVERQKIPVDERYAPAIQSVIDRYPKYCSIKELPGYGENPEMMEFITELTELQILLVQ